jgi:aspartyl protease family protein
MRALLLAYLLCTAMALAAARAVALEIVAEGLFPGFAVLRIDGERVSLRDGQRHGSVRLVEASADGASLLVDGKAMRLGLSGRISADFTAPAERTLQIRRNEQMQYRTTAEINGRRVEVLVDTGANTVAMNQRQAQRLGIDLEAGRLARVQTASDVLPARQVTLDSVSVGGIRVETVPAIVIDGEQPATVLLGMSYLRHVQLEDRDGVLTIRGRW